MRCVLPQKLPLGILQKLQLRITAQQQHKIIVVICMSSVVLSVICLSYVCHPNLIPYNCTVVGARVRPFTPLSTSRDALALVRSSP